MFLCVFVFFFFFKQKTAYEMRISDWSSDVCSSDLIEQRRYHQIEVSWSEGMDPLQRVRAISAGTADFLSKMTDRDIQAADRVLRLQVMPPGVSQVDLRLAAQFEKNSPE